MPGLHLPFDLFVRFSVRFFRYRRWLRATVLCIYIVNEQRKFRRRTGEKPYGNRAKIVRKSCSHRAVSAASARKSYGARAASAQRPRGDSTVTCEPRVVFRHSCTKSVQHHISACVVGWDDNLNKRREGKEHQDGKCSLRKAAARLWCGRRGIAER